MIMPLYVAETSPAKARGLLVSLVQIGIVTGILASFCTGWMAADLGPTNWRWMFGAGVVPALVLLLVTLALPESPRWLISQGGTQSARDLLTSVMGQGDADATLAEIEESLKSESGSWSELFQPGIRRALIIGLVLAVLSVTVGINAVILYGPVILLEGAGEDVSAALLGTVALGGVNFVFSLVAMVAIDRVGRKPLLLCGLIGMGISMLILGFRFSAARVDSSPGLLIPILSFVAFYAVSLGPIAWVLVSEIFPTKTRGAGMAICIIVMYLADFVVTLAFPWMMEELGSGGFHVFAAVCGVGILFVFALVPETKGKSLEEIETMWSRRGAESLRLPN
jgi:sugar porter (SP) family MFS transporter